MNYFLNKVIKADFDEAITKVMQALKEEGFGVLTDIDIAATLKKKLDVDFRKYRILGACNPPLAHQALQSERNIGVMLPCNVVVQESEAGHIEITAINPQVEMQSTNNPELKKTAALVSQKLQAVLDHIANQ